MVRLVLIDGFSEGGTIQWKELQKTMKIMEGVRGESSIGLLTEQVSTMRIG